MPWADYDADSALERDLLARALPLVPTTSDSSSGVVIDMAANTAKAAMTINVTIGPNPSGCVKLLGIRPLLVGAAWKVVDRLLEEALDQAGELPDMKRGWSIVRKVSHATAGDAQPGAIDAPAWRALMQVYAATSELRHSLVHRRAHVDASDALVGVDDTGAALQPLGPGEQEALARAALRAAQLVIATAPDARVAVDLARQLGLLSGLHSESLPAVTLLDSLPEITAIVDPTDEGTYRFDLPALRARQPFKEAAHADLIVQFRDRPGQDLRGRLEDAPDDVVSLDPDNPPAWLQ